MTTLFDQYGIPRQLEDLSAVAKLAKLKEISGNNPWPVIEECFKIWSSKNPKKWDSYLFYLQDIKETRKSTTVGGKSFRGVTKDKGHDGYISYTADFPQPVMYMVRCLYNADELPMDKHFFETYARKYPNFTIREAKH